MSDKNNEGNLDEGAQLPAEPLDGGETTEDSSGHEEELSDIKYDEEANILDVEDFDRELPVAGEHAEDMDNKFEEDIEPVALTNEEATPEPAWVEAYAATAATENPTGILTKSSPTLPTLTSAHSIISAHTSVNGTPQHRTRRRIAPVKTYWGGTAILSAAVVFLIVQIIIAMGLVGYLIFSDPDALEKIQNNPDFLTTFIGQTPPLLVGSQVLMYLSWLGCMWWVTKYRSGVQLGKKFWKAFQDNFWLRFKKIDLLIGLGIALGMQGFQYLALNVLPTLFPQINMEGAGNTAIFESIDGAWFFIIAFGIGSLLGPICEELFFRGFLMRGFVNHYSFVKDKRNIDILQDELGKQATGLQNIVIVYRTWASKHRYALAIILSSILFGFMHFQGSETFGQWLVVIVTGTLGLVLAVVTYKLQRISPAIIGHILYNAISFGLLMLLS